MTVELYSQNARGDRDVLLGRFSNHSMAQFERAFQQFSRRTGTVLVPSRETRIHIDHLGLLLSVFEKELRRTRLCDSGRSVLDTFRKAVALGRSAILVGSS